MRNEKADSENKSML